jgi:hypothetical protein
MNNIDDSTRLIDALSLHIKTNGVEKTIKLLNYIGSTKNWLEDDYTNLVLDSVSEALSISVDEFVNSRYLRGENKIAIGFCIYYLYEKMTLGEINRCIFKSKDKSLLSKYKTLIENLNPKYTTDVKYLKIKSILDKKLK